MGQFLNDGLHSRGSSQEIVIYTKTNERFLTFYPREIGDNIYTIYTSFSEEENHPHTIYKMDFETMHRRLAHPSNEVLRKAGEHTKDFPDIEIQESHVCPGCAQGKMTNKSFPASEKRAAEPFELIHSDLKSFPIESYRKYKYSIVFLDDYTSHAWTINLRTKDAALPATKQFIAMVETQYQARVQKWKSDAGGEYTSKAFKELLKDRGIEILQSVPHAHQQNGCAERIIRTLMEKAESMRLQACLPQSYWEFAIEHATHVYNQTPMRRLEWRTPYEWMTGEKPTLRYLRVFGSGAYVFIPSEVRQSKMSPKSELMTYIGMALGKHRWLFMRSPKNILFTAAQATFDESLFPKCPKTTPYTNTRLQENAPPVKRCKDGNHCVGGKHCHCPISDNEDEEELPPTSSSNTKGKEVPARTRDQEVTEEIQCIPLPKGNDQGNLPPLPVRVPEQEQQPRARRPQRERKVPAKYTKDNVYGDKHPVQIEKETRRQGDWRKIVGEQSSLPRQNAPGPSSQPDPPVLEDSDSESEVRDSLDPSDDGSEVARLCQEGGAALSHFLITKSIDTTRVLGSEEFNLNDNSIPYGKSSPKEWTFRDVLKLPSAHQKEWTAACKREIQTLQNREVFELVKRPRDRKIIKNRWVFDIKDDGRKRARLVAKGFSQVEGLDYDQVFSPVVRFETVRLILAMAALNNWVTYGLDVRNAYLYGELNEELYMEQPEGFRVLRKEDLVLRLKCALYGLKQAGLAWWRALKQSMEELGFISLSSNAGVFIFRGEGSFVIAIIYVNDAIFCGPAIALVKKLKEAFMKRWETRDLGELKEFLRMRITRDGSKIHIDQCAYLRTVLERCGMTNAKSAATPLPAGYVPTKKLDGVTNPELRNRFQTIIGSLLYPMPGTRPDIAFAVTKLAQFAANPLQEHLDKALYICRYLVGTQDYRLTYDGSSKEGLSAVTDSDWASDNITRRSQSGYFMKLAGGLISWTSRAQKTIALSSTEAEYMALSDCSRQTVWVHTLLGELGYQLRPIPICRDNQGSIFIASNPVTEKRSKHIDIRYHYIREVISRGLVNVYFINGEENPADLLTKNLGSVKFHKFRAMLGLSFNKL